MEEKFNRGTLKQVCRKVLLEMQEDGRLVPYVLAAWLDLVEELTNEVLERLKEEEVNNGNN